jgi:putative transposase
MQKQHLQLAPQDRLELEGLLLKSSLTVKIHKRIQVLLGLDSGKSYQTVGKEVGMTYISMRKIGSKYTDKQAGVPALTYLSDKPRSGRPIVISGDERAKITALACSHAPEGHSHWGLRLLADKVVELGICRSLSHTYAGEILKKTNCSHILNAPGVLA